VGQLPSLQIPAFEYVVDHQVAILALSFLGLIGPIAGGWAFGFLGVATRARRPELRRWVVYLPIVGGVLTGIAFFMLRGVDAVINAHRILDGPRTVSDATKITGLFIFGQAVGIFGQLAAGGGYVLVSLNAMRAGLLTRALGILGIAAGVFTVLAGQLGTLLQLMIQAVLALMFFGFWMGGVPPAWRTGKAEPWPARQPPPSRRAAEPAPQAAEPAEPAAPRRGKRKKRH
jgi:MFS family permease